MTEHIRGPAARSGIPDPGGVGTLVLETPAALAGLEIEISQVAAAAQALARGRTHSLVREHRTPAGISYAAVYPRLAVGRYLIWRRMDTPVGEVVIDAGAVTRFRWPE